MSENITKNIANLLESVQKDSDAEAAFTCAELCSKSIKEILSHIEDWNSFIDNLSKFDYIIFEKRNLIEIDLVKILLKNLSRTESSRYGKLTTFLAELLDHLEFEDYNPNSVYHSSLPYFMYLFSEYKNEKEDHLGIILNYRSLSEEEKTEFKTFLTKQEPYNPISLGSLVHKLPKTLFEEYILKKINDESISNGNYTFIFVFSRGYHKYFTRKHLEKLAEKLTPKCFSLFINHLKDYDSDFEQLFNEDLKNYLLFCDKVICLKPGEEIPKKVKVSEDFAKSLMKLLTHPHPAVRKWVKIQRDVKSSTKNEIEGYKSKIKEFQNKIKELEQKISQEN